MLVSRRNRTRLIFILVYLTVIIQRDIPITSGESERVCGSLSRCVVRRTQGCCVASAFRASGSWTRPFFSRCSLVWEVQGTATAARRVGYKISEPLHCRHCQDGHNSEWHWAGESRSVSILQALPHRLTRGEGLLGSHNWKGYVTTRNSVSLQLGPLLNILGASP